MNILKRLNIFPDESAVILPSVLSIMLGFIIMSGAVLTLIQSNLGIVGRNVKSQQAFNIAEAGANYYLWHLSHSPLDFKDGQSTPTTPDPALGYGPYVHDYYDDNSKKTGKYTLWIKPDSVGSTVATVRSIGEVNGSNIKRTVEVKIGATSFASYGLVSDSVFWFGNTESADGPVHSNIGIRMDGPSNGEVTSSNSTYVPPGSYGGDGTSKPGVWCHPSITTPVNCNTRSKADWRYPVPLVDFNLVSSSLCNIKKEAFKSDAGTASLAALANACTQTPTTRTNAYLPQRSTTGTYNIARGYMIELNPAGTYNLYQVNGETDTQTTWTTALTEVLVANNITIPASGVIFAEDNVWVRSNPTYSGRVTIGSGRLATTQTTNIVIADDLVYGTKNGDDAIGLVSENDVLVAPYAIPQTGAFNFEVNAAIIAQAGSVRYPSTYRSSSSTCTRGWVNNNQQFLFYGSIATRQAWTWTVTSGSSCANSVNDGTGTYWRGVKNNTTQYDYNLEYAPPPNYPITGGHNILSWREVLTQP